MNLKILDKYNLIISEIPDTLEKNEKRIGEPYWNFLKNKKRDITNEAVIMENLISKIKANTVIEYFAGIGMNARIVDHFLSPIKHTLLDIDQTCINILKQNFKKKEIIKTDSLSYKPKEIYDLSVLDYNKFTILHEFLDEPFQSDYIILTDSAISKFHLNKKYYDVTDVDDYAQRYLDLISKKYNRYLTHFYYFSKASYLLFQSKKTYLEIMKFDEKPNVKFTKTRNLL